MKELERRVQERTEAFQTEIAERKRAEEAKNRQVAFENMVSGILARFASCTAAEVDQEITAGLNEIGLFLGLGSVFVILVSKETGTWSSVYNWIAPGVPSIHHKYQNVPIGTNPWSEKALLRMESIQINSLDDLPPEAESERRAYESEGVKSLLLVPLRGRGARVIGSAGFRSYSRQIQWTQEDIRSLRLFSDTIANVLERKRADVEVIRQNKVLKAVSRIFEAAIRTETERDFVHACTEIIESVTGSKISFIGAIGPNGCLHDLAMRDTGWELCAMHDKTGHRRLPEAFLISRTLREGPEG